MDIRSLSDVLVAVLQFVTAVAGVLWLVLEMKRRR